MRSRIFGSILVTLIAFMLPEAAVAKPEIPAKLQIELEGDALPGARISVELSTSVVAHKGTLHVTIEPYVENETLKAIQLATESLSQTEVLRAERFIFELPPMPDGRFRANVVVTFKPGSDRPPVALRKFLFLTISDGRIQASQSSFRRQDKEALLEDLHQRGLSGLTMEELNVIEPGLGDKVYSFLRHPHLNQKMNQLDDSISEEEQKAPDIPSPVIGSVAEADNKSGGPDVDQE